MPWSRPTVFAVAVTVSSACGGGAGEVAGRVTFNEHVAPIVFDKCAACHRPGEVAPFPLLSYDDVKAESAAIARETRARHMPPWLPEPGEFPLTGVRRLSDEQISTIERWIAQGMAEGDAARLAPPVFPDGWQLGRPDVVATTTQPYRLTPQATDVYRNLVIRTAVPTTKYVRAVEFRTNGAPIHHAVVRIDRTSASRRRDGRDGNAGFDGMTWNLFDPDGHFIGWAPGRGPIVPPEGMAWRLEPGMDLVVEVHIIPGTVAADVRPEIGLYFTDTPPSRTPVTVKMGSKLIDIPAGQASYEVTDTYDLPFNVDLLAVYPHAHYLATDMKVTATMPDGRARTLLHIPRWSFHWQQDYRFVTPVALPRGTRLTMRYVFDNSAKNPSNPNTPPRRVQAGPKSTDEMAELGLQFLTSSQADSARLQEAFVLREQHANLAMAEQRVRTDPENAENRAFLGGTYVQAGRHADALPHLNAALRLGDRTAATQSDLGAVMMALNRPDMALSHFQRAAELGPDDEVAQFNLGTTLAAVSRATEAEAAYRKALSINPDYLDAHVNLGVALLMRRRVDEALTHFRAAADLQPGSAVMHHNLGGALMAAGRHREALASVTRALAIAPGHPGALDNLRRLNAMGIR